MLKRFNEKFRNEGWYPNNWEPIESFLLQTYRKGRKEAFESGWHKGRTKLVLDLEWGQTTLGEPMTKLINYHRKTS